ncbi:Outer membrane efflux protein BepC precursor [compost metagenome]
MSVRLRILSSLLPALLALGPADAAVAAPLAEVCGRALAQDPELAAASQAVRELDERLTVAYTGLFPRLRVLGELASDQYTRAGGYAPLFTRAAEVGATELIFDGGATWHRAAATRLERDAVVADRAVTANRVAFQAAIAALTVARNRAWLAASERYAAEHDAAVAQVAAMARADRGKVFDLKQVTARAVFARSQVTERRAELAASEARLLELSGAPAPAIDVPAPLSGPGLDALDSALSLADGAHPALNAWRHRQASRQAAVHEAQAAFQPLVSAEAIYRLGIDRNGLPGRNDEGYVGVRGTVALAAGGGQTSAIRAAQAESARVASRLESSRRDVREAVRLAWDRRAGLAATVPLAEASDAASRAVVEGFRAQYKSGQRTVLDLLRVQADAYGAETRLIGLRFDRLMADYELAHSQGRLADWLPVPDHSPLPQVSR